MELIGELTALRRHISAHHVLVEVGLPGLPFVQGPAQRQPQPLLVLEQGNPGEPSRIRV